MPVQITQGSGTNVDTAVVGVNNREIICVGSATATDTAGVTAANGVQVDVTRVQGNVAITAASLPLPAGASTAAKQPALGTAGTASADVISIQGIASMTAVKVDGSAVTQPVSGTVTANIGTAGTLALDASVTGLQVAQASTTSGQKGPLAQGAVTTAAPTYTTAQTSPLSLTTAGALRVDPSAVTQPISGTITANQGGTWTVQPGNTQNSTPWLFGEIPLTTGGLSVSSFLSTAAVQSTSAKGSAGQVYGIHAFNNSGTIAYVRLYNQTAAPASGDTANIIWRGLIPANTSGAGAVIPVPAGLKFSTGIGYRVTAAVADNDTTALAANAILFNLLFI